MVAENFPGGYAGKIARIDLTNGTVVQEELNDIFCRKYIGGAGFIAHYLYNEMKPHVDPLGLDNMLIFALGPITGVAVPGSGRHCVGAKSPLTGGIAKSEVGEFWGAELKRAGFDAIIITGKAPKPVYLWIKDGEIAIKDAAYLWGQKTGETQTAIRQELGDEHVRVSLIGPGGENMVKYACIMSGLYDAAGRGGLGAVMGSKNLKAVAVKGSQSPKVINPDGVKGIRQWVLDNPRGWQDFHDNGTGAWTKGFVATGNLPIRNFRDGLIDNFDSIDAKVLLQKYGAGMEGCFACPVRCKKRIEVKEGPYIVDVAYGGPEYETLAAFGSDCGIVDGAAVSLANQLAGEYSLDTISCGGSIAFAMECYEKGLLTTKDTGGLEMKWGNIDAMLKSIELIGKNEGFGKFMALGTKRMAEKIGHNSIDFAINNKGLEMGMHEPRFKQGLGLGFMVSPIGGDHCLNMHDSGLTGPWAVRGLQWFGFNKPLSATDIDAQKVAQFKNVQFHQILNDSLVVCQFIPYSDEFRINLTAAVTGWNTSAIDQHKVAERILTTMRMFNLREGLSAKDDGLPKRFFQPKTDGFLADKPLNPEKMEAAKSYYYTLMGWDPTTGVPLPMKLQELEIKPLTEAIGAAR